MRPGPALRNAVLALLVGASAFAAYLGSLDNGFIWDDPIVLEQQMVAFKSLKDVFLPPENIPQYGIFYYRPLIVCSYLIDFWFSGPRPMEIPEGAINPFHASVVVYHAIVSVLVFLFGLMLFRSRPWAPWAAFAGALLFAVHPIHTESVCWMAGRSDVLAALGIVPAMTLYLLARQRRSPWLFVAAAGAYLIGLWAKETGVAALLALPALELVPLEPRPAVAAAGGADAEASDGGSGRKGKRRGRRATGRRAAAAAVRTGPGPLWRYAPFAAATLIYWFMRSRDLSRSSGGGGSLSSLALAVDLQTQRDRFADIVLDLVGAVGFYLRKVFVPTHLNAFVADVPRDAPTLLLGLVGIVGAGALGTLAVRRGAHVALVLGSVFFATLAPSLAIAVFNISEAAVAERYLYIPSLAVCLGAAFLVGELADRLRARSGAGAARGALAGGIAAGAVVTVLFGAATFARNETWATDLVFWEDAVAKAPHQGLPHLHLGLVYDRWPSDDPEVRKRYDELAEKEYRLALNEQEVVYDIEGRSTAWNNLANLYLRRDDHDEAEKCFRNSIGMRPTYHTPHYGMGLVYYRRALIRQRAGDGPEAVRLMTESRNWLSRAIQLNPRYVKAFLLRGTVLMSLSDHPAARRDLEAVVRLQPGSNEADRASELLGRIAAQPAGGP